MGYLIIIVVLFAAMWLFLIRPQKRRQVEQSRMQDSTSRAGDEILTAGGIHGTVEAIEGEVVQVEIAPGTIVRLDRRAVAAVVQEPEPEPEKSTRMRSDPVSPGES